MRTCCATAHAQRTSPDSPWPLLQRPPIAACLCLPRSACTRVHWRASTSVSSRSSCSPSSHLYGELNEDLSARPRSRKRGAGGRARCTDSTAPSPPGEAAHDGPVRKGICHWTIVCGLRACAPECALTVPAWRVHTLLYKHAYICSPVGRGTQLPKALHDGGCRWWNRRNKPNKRSSSVTGKI